MSVTVTAEFDSVDFAERAAKRIRARYSGARKAVIRCHRMREASNHGIGRTILPVQSAYSYFEAAAYTNSDSMFSLKPTSISHPETEENHSATLSITTNNLQASTIAGQMISCGGYNVRTV